MISSGLEKGFSLIWAIIKLNLLFLSLSLCGGIILGVGPAFQTMSDLICAYGLEHQEQTWKAAWHRWKTNFLKANLHFWLFIMISFIVGYNLYLSTQIIGILWFVIDMILIFILLLLFILYLYVLLNEATFEIGLFNLLKISFISLFLNFGVFLKILFGIAGIILFTWSMKGLVVFGSFSLILLWVHFASRKTRELISGKLTYEA